MDTNPSNVAKEYRLKEWAEMIRDCQNRPMDITVKEWCDEHHITKANYYYRLRQVRKVCIGYLPAEASEQKVVAISENLLSCTEQKTSSLELAIHGARLHVTDETSPDLLKMVLGMIADVK